MRPGPRLGLIDSVSARMRRQRFRKLISGQRPAKPLLPLVHTTDVYRFRDALEDGWLEPRECPVFDKEPLLEAPTALDHYLPVCFLFRTSAVHPIKRIFPFDSGA